jgi:hypothetical protein
MSLQDTVRYALLTLEQCDDRRRGYRIHSRPRRAGVSSLIPPTMTWRTGKKRAALAGNAWDNVLSGIEDGARGRYHGRHGERRSTKELV